MRVLLVGNGGREHSIAWKLRQSPRLSDLLVAPGNAGTAQLAENVPVGSQDIQGLLTLARQRRCDLTVVGPEAPLAAGIADRFEAAGLPVFGPTSSAARIETSKSFAKSLMARHGIPTGRAAVFDDYATAKEYVRGERLPLVVKADGLAAGKAVTVAATREEALDALRDCLVDRRFGDAGERVLIEECMEGPEVSVFAFVDGERVSDLVAACDYKRVGDGNTGPNTGGMGSYSPPQEALWGQDVERRVREGIMEPAVQALADEGAPYRGVLYAGLMLTEDGPRVVEFNCRLGDPESQVVLPRLKTDLLDAMMATAEGDLSGIRFEWDDRHCVGIVMASGGYPGEHTTGYPIDGIDDVDDDVLVFHAGTSAERRQGEPAPQSVSAGGRVLTVSGLGRTLGEARSRAYAGAAGIRFQGAFYRTDVGLPA